MRRLTGQRVGTISQRHGHKERTILSPTLAEMATLSRREETKTRQEIELIAVNVELLTADKLSNKYLEMIDEYLRKAMVKDAKALKAINFPTEEEEKKRMKKKGK